MSESKEYKEWSKKVQGAKNNPPGKRIKILLDQAQIYPKGV